MSKTIESINTKIAAGKARIVRADEMTRIVREHGARRAAEDVDVVTTGTFGAMCSSGVWLNDVEAYAGVAAVDAYLGATQASTAVGIGYGGAHVIEDLLRGRPIVLRAVSRGTDCYPRKRILTEVRLEDLNFALLANPRNGYQRYDAAANSGSETIQTYMGELSPLNNDPGYRTVGVGTRVFLGGAPPYAEIRRDIALVAAVGEGVLEQPGAAGRVLAALAREKIGIETAMLGASDVSACVVIARDEEARAVRTLHREFIHS